MLPAQPTELLAHKAGKIGVVSSQFLDPSVQPHAVRAVLEGSTVLDSDAGTIERLAPK